ncbi:MAG: four-helix bundle copper-binding protein [Kineosporiaceae bacterium]
MTILEMITSSPSPALVEATALAHAIERLDEAAQACTACADACLAEDDPAQLRECIRRTGDAADVLAATSRVLSRQTSPDLGLVRVLLEAAVVAGKRAAAECERHAEMHVHCAVAADAARRCEAATRSLLEQVRHGVPQAGPLPGRGDGPDTDAVDLDAVAGEDVLGGTGTV